MKNSYLYRLFRIFYRFTENYIFTWFNKCPHLWVTVATLCFTRMPIAYGRAMKMIMQQARRASQSLDGNSTNPTLSLLHNHFIGGCNKFRLSTRLQQLIQMERALIQNLFRQKLKRCYKVKKLPSKKTV